MEKLYDIKLPMDSSRKNLYVCCDMPSCFSDYVSAGKNNSFDLGTYFNLFSIKSWIKYTSITLLKISLLLTGKYTVEIYGISKDKKNSLEVFQSEDNCFKSISKEVLQKWLKDGNELLGIKIISHSKEIRFYGGYYSAEFASSKNVSVGITICTFKREEYVKRNLIVLKKLCNDIPQFNVTIVDNGKSLNIPAEKNIKIIPNPNYGGSGGFTRGLIEQIQQTENSHVLMMDDDILIEISSLQRLYAFLRHIKKDYEEQMIAGSMLRMDIPSQQFENSAYWGKIRMRALGRGLDLTRKEDLYKNENLPKHKNKYAAWWFCCIPVTVIKHNGFPLPVFIKGDDMEYGIRNGKEVITMNGIGVWHEPFKNKANPVVNYFNDRNMLIVNHYADGGNRWYFLGILLARLARRVLEKDLASVKMYELALKDYASGLSGITNIGSDEKFEQVKAYRTNKNILTVFLKIFVLGIQEFVFFNKRHKEYLNFRKEKLSDAVFWKQFLRIESDN